MRGACHQRCHGRVMDVLWTGHTPSRWHRSREEARAAASRRSRPTRGSSGAGPPSAPPHRWLRESSPHWSRSQRGGARTPARRKSPHRGWRCRSRGEGSAAANLRPTSRSGGVIKVQRPRCRRRRQQRGTTPAALGLRCSVTPRRRGRQIATRSQRRRPGGGDGRRPISRRRSGRKERWRSQKGKKCNKFYPVRATRRHRHPPRGSR